MLCAQLYQAEWGYRPGGGTSPGGGHCLAHWTELGPCMCVLPENRVMAGWHQGLEEMPREDFSTFPCGQTLELACLPLLFSAALCISPMCQLLTGSSLWCWGSSRSESGISQLDRPQLDPEGTGFREAPLSRTASAAEGRGRTYLDHWALFTSGLPLQASQTHAGPFLRRLNRSPP